MGERIVNKRGPENYENQKRAELYPFGKSAGDQGRCNNREHHLVNHKRGVWNGCRIVRVRFGSNSIETKPIQTADPSSARIGTKGQAITVESPLNRNYGNDNEAVHDRAEGVLAPD